MEWTTIITAYKVGKTVLDENSRKKLMTYLSILIRQNRKIILFGSSGNGKSQFINSLNNSTEIPQRTRTTGKERYNLVDYPILFRDTPGHEVSFKDRQDEVKLIMKDGVEGIINFVSYGYAENPDLSSDLAYDQHKNLKPDFLEKNREIELQRLDEWLDWIDTKNTKWIINLVNKADLWWDNQNDVYEYYENGPYGEKFKEMKRFVKIVNIPYCSIIKPYFDVKTSGIFGDNEKYALWNHFQSNLLTLLTK